MLEAFTIGTGLRNLRGLEERLLADAEGVQVRYRRRDMQLRNIFGSGPVRTTELILEGPDDRLSDLRQRLLAYPGLSVSSQGPITHASLSLTKPFLDRRKADRFLAAIDGLCAVHAVSADHHVVSWVRAVPRSQHGPYGISSWSREISKARPSR